MCVRSRKRLQIVVLAALCAGVDATVRATIENPLPSDSFVDSIGVNTHARHTTGPYNNWNSVIAAIGDIGFRNVRHIPDNTPRLNQLSAATGAKVDVIMQDGETTLDAINMDLLPTVLNRTKQLTNIGVLEGPNER